MNFIKRFFVLAYDHIRNWYFIAFVIAWFYFTVVGQVFVAFVIGCLLLISGILTVKYERKIEKINTIKEKLDKYLVALKKSNFTTEFPSVAVLSMKLEELQKQEKDLF